MQVTTPEPITLRLVASKQALEEIEKEIPNVEERTNEQNDKE
jgi:hypothetical protein